MDDSYLSATGFMNKKVNKRRRCISTVISAHPVTESQVYRVKLLNAISRKLQNLAQQ